MRIEIVGEELAMVRESGQVPHPGLVPQPPLSPGRGARVRD